MTDPRASTALLSFPLGDPPPSRWSWGVVWPDASGRVRLPAPAVEVLGPGPVAAWIRAEVLVLRPGGEDGRPVTVDRRGRLYLPAWLRRPGLLVATPTSERVVLLADAVLLDPVGDRLLVEAEA